MENTAASKHVVYFDLDVKSWASATPGVREARPACCPGCGTPSVLPSGKIVVQGHGLRGRQRWGPHEPDGGAEIGELIQRRYRCERCRTIVIVRPRGVLRRRRYTAAAIALALWMWAVELTTDAIVRSKTSPRATTGISRPERWTALRRWAKAVRAGELLHRVTIDASWTLRQCAERWTRVLAGLADAQIVGDRQRIFAAAERAR